MATLSNNDIAHGIYLGTIEKKSQELSLYYKNVVQFLSRKNLLSKSEDILAKLQKIINKEENRIVARVSSVEKITEKNKQHLVSIFKKRYSAQEVTLVENLDKKLLGGMRLEVNDEVIDFSIKNKIGELKEYLTRS